MCVAFLATTTSGECAKGTSLAENISLKTRAGTEETGSKNKIGAEIARTEIATVTGVKRMVRGISRKTTVAASWEDTLSPAGLSNGFPLTMNLSAAESPREMSLQQRGPKVSIQ